MEILLKEFWSIHVDTIILARSNFNEPEACRHLSHFRVVECIPPQWLCYITACLHGCLTLGFSPFHGRVLEHVLGNICAFWLLRGGSKGIASRAQRTKQLDLSGPLRLKVWYRRRLYLIVWVSDGEGERERERPQSVRVRPFLGVRSFPVCPSQHCPSPYSCLVEVV